MSETKTPTIEDAILALAAMDTDYATVQNGVGFNGRDTAFGNSLAFQIKGGRSLSARQKAAAYRMLRTYKVQLLGYGISYDEIPAPEKPEPKEQPTGHASMRDGNVVVRFDAAPGPLLDSVKSVPGRRYTGPPANEWFFPLSAGTLPYVESWPPERFVIDQDVREAIAEIYREMERSAEASRAVSADLDGLAFAHELMPFQRAGVAYAVDKQRVLIGDEMGLGKTVQALATLEHEHSYPALVVVPAVVKLNWRNEIRRWLPDREVVVLSGRKGSAEALMGAEIVVVNYDILPGWLDVLKLVSWKAMVADESHYLKNSKAARTKATKALGKNIPTRLLLTGTPVLNRPVELIAQLEVLGMLDAFGGFWGFANRYCDAYKGPWGWVLTGSSNLGELHEKLRGLCYVRRTKDQVLTELPPKRRATIPIEISRMEYERVLKDLTVWLKQRIQADKDWKERLSKLDPASAEFEAQAEAWRREQRMGRAKALVMIEALKQTCARLKLDGAFAWVDDFLETGKKLVLFAHHKEIAQAFEQRYGDACVSITGDTAPEQRQVSVDRFQTDETVRLFVGNIQAAGVGITLTAASDVAFVELPWRPGDLTQAEDRCHRIGQEDSVTCWYLLAAATIEERIAGMLDEKRRVVDQATDGKDGLDPDDSLLDALLDVMTKEAQ